MTNQSFVFAVLRWTTIVPFLALLSSCDEEGPDVVQGRPLPICKQDGRSYSADQIYQKALVDLKRHATSRGCSETALSDLENNTDCCEIVFGINAEGSKVAGLLPVNGTSYQIGRLRASFYCAAEMPLRPYRSVVATVTSCGNLVSVGGLNEEARSPYPTKFSW